MAGKSVGQGAASGAAAGSVFGPWGTVIGGVVGGAAALLGKKDAPPTVPYLAPNPQQAQKNAIEGNLGSLSDLETLLSTTNRFQQGQATSLMEQAIPGYGKFAKKLLEFGSSSLDNPSELPTDVQENLSRLAAERGVHVGGGVGSQFEGFSALRDFGINMLQFRQQNFNNALTALTTVTGTAPRINPMSPLSFLIAPQEQLAADTHTAQIQQGIGQGAENAKTAAANWNNQNDWTSIAASLGQILGAMNTDGIGGTRLDAAGKPI